MVKVDRKESPPTESEIIKYSCLIPKSSHIRLETKIEPYMERTESSHMRLAYCALEWVW